MSDQDWMNTTEAAKYAEISPRVLARLAHAKKIQHGSNGRHYRFKKEHLDAWLLSNGWVR